MPANRFDTSKTQEYVSQYVPLPFEAISALGEKANKNFEEGKQVEANLGALGAAIKAAKPYEKDRERFINEYNNQIKALVDEAKGDYGSRDFKAKASALTTQFKNDSRVQAFAETKEAFDNWQKAKLAGNAKDLDYTYDMDPNDPTGTNFRQRDVLKEGVYSNRITKYSDWGKAANEAVGKVAVSGGDKIGNLNLANTKIEGGKLYERIGTKWVGVSEDKLKNVVSATVPVYASSEGGQNHLETILQKDFGYGQNAYNVRYMDIDNASQQATRRINSGQGTKEDQQAVDMKKQIDQELYNFMYGANKHQEGIVIDKTVQDKLIDDPNTNSGSGTPNNPNNIALWNLTKTNADPSNDNPINKALHAANPNTVFEGTKDGNVKFIKRNEIGTRNKVVYTDSRGQKWDPENPPKGWRFEKDPSKVNTYYKGLASSGVFVSRGGTAINPLRDFTRSFEKVSNMDQYTKQVNEVLQWAAATGQLVSAKTKSGSEQYEELLPKYIRDIKNGALNAQYIPQADAETADNFNNLFLPSTKTTTDGTVITNPGLVTTWTVDGIDNTNFEEKTKILENARYIGMDMRKGSSYIRVAGTDGQEHSVDMNNPTLAATFGALSSFIQKNNKNKINPQLGDSKEALNTTMNYINSLNQNALDHAKEIGYDLQEVTNRTLLLNKSFEQNLSLLASQGYTPSDSYLDPTTNTIAISLIKHGSNNPDVQVIKYDQSTDSGFKIMSEAAFDREIQQKAFGNFAANNDKNASKTKATFTTTQYR